MTLGGAIFIREGVKFDYCFQEAIKCLQELCDEVCILAIGGEDETVDICMGYEDQHTSIVYLDSREWEEHKGRERLSYFQNLCKSFLTTDYYFLLQGDEILHEDSFDAVRKAIETGAEAFYCERINIWRDCNSYINVEPERQPCNTQIIRLAKLKYGSVGDGESIEAFADPHFIDDIRIYHMGFVRKREIMKAKVINMQETVFQLGFHDPKLDQSEMFDWSFWFNEKELSQIHEPLPKFIKYWASKRP